jgi:hypothetical protein
MTEAFTSYGRSVAVIFACAFAVFFAQELSSEVALGVGATVSGLIAMILWLRFRGTEYRFLVGVAAVVAVTFLTFFVTRLFPNSGLAYFTAFLLVATLAFFALYAFIKPPQSTV